MKNVLKKILQTTDGKSEHEEFAIEVKDGGTVTTIECYIRRKYDNGQLVLDKLYVTDNVSMVNNKKVNKLYIDEEIEEAYATR